MTGCSLRSAEPDRQPEADPLEPLLADLRTLIDRYQQALSGLSGHPELAERLTGIQHAHLAHEEALAALVGRPGPAGTPAGWGRWTSPLASPSASGPAEPLPEADLAELVSELRELEQRARDEATEACLSAPPERAAVLGSVTAARATHVEVLA